MHNISGFAPTTATRPTDRGLAFPIFRNGTPEQLRAGAELKATQAGHQGAFADGPFGDGAFAHHSELASFLGGRNAAANDDLPASILEACGHAPPAKPSAAALKATPPRDGRPQRGAETQA